MTREAGMKAGMTACIGLCLCLCFSGCAAKSAMTSAAWRHPDHSDPARVQRDESACKRLAADSVRAKRTAYERERRKRDDENVSLPDGVGYSMAADVLTGSSFDMEEQIVFRSCMRDLGYVPAGPDGKSRNDGAAGKAGESARKQCEADCRSMYEAGQLKEGMTVERCTAAMCGAR
jgi:hypothetical protein